MNNNFSRAGIPFALALPLALVLSACGGGGSSGSATSSGVTLSGTAATGAALAGATITATCATGGGTTTAASDGTYTLTLTGATLPCVLTAVSADNSVTLHSVAAGTGTGAATSNITPLSELLVAQIAGTDPTTFAAGFSSSTTISATDVQAAQTAVLQTLTSAGLDTSAVGDILSGSLTAGSGTGYDGVLDALQVTLTGAATTLTELTTAVATTSGSGTTTGASTVTTLLSTANSSCTAFKSGTHRVIDFTDGEASTVTFNAAVPNVTIEGTTYTLTTNGTCDYTINNSTSTRLLVTRSGMAVWREGSGLTGAVAISVPEQTLDLTSLGGTYNRVSYKATTVPAGDFGTVTFDTAGVNTTSMNCTSGYGSCVEDPHPDGHLVVNNGGGFDYIDDGQGGVLAARVFAFRNSAGKTAMFALETDGTVTIFSKQGDLALPAVNDTSAFWQFTINTTGGTGTLTEDANTVTAADATTKLVTRQFTSDNHFDVLKFNDPYSGMRYRAVNDCTNSNGSVLTCNATIQVPLQGSGITLSVSASSSKHFMTVSIVKP